MDEGRKMSAAVYKDGTIKVKTMPRPEPVNGELLLQVEAAALCATDIKIHRRGHRNIPSGSEAILGHEVVGRVAQIGSNVDPALLGKRMVVPPNVGCGLCPACQAGMDSYCSDYRAYGVGMHGGLAEYMLVTAPSVTRGNLIEVPARVPTRIAVLAEAVSCCYRGLSDCGLKAGETVLIMGAGPMGILSVVVAWVMGASTVIVADPLEARRANSFAFHADYALDPTAGDFEKTLQQITGGWGVDVVLVTAPFVQAQQKGIAVAAVGGRVNLFAGLSPDDSFNDFPANLVHYRGLKVLGTTGTTAVEMNAVVQLMAGGKLDILKEAITAIYPLADTGKALEEAGHGGGLKVMVVPDDNLLVE
ncbi:MAG TPA: alcohol dehydrogenase catalytic domain-containing protein [Candidatus Limnocylindrales bacterium]|nr:alcohol dehydrogenase catalytic domain-containing protein [Candidatus Limnocylindrales bacterium]